LQKAVHSEIELNSMKKRSRRLVKKLHSRWINDVMIDASQVSY
jgi:hypothetical protein